MNYELAKELKDAGFKQPFVAMEGHYLDSGDDAEGYVYAPTLSELISATPKFKRLFVVRPDFWQAEADEPEVFGTGDTPEMAVAKRWLTTR